MVKKDGWISEEKALHKDMVELYDEDPNWDFAGCVAAVARFLKSGKELSRADLLAIYGEKVIAAAETLLNEQNNKKT